MAKYLTNGFDLLNKKNQTILLSIFIFYVFALPLILLDYNAGRAFGDQNFGHLPAIKFFIEQLDFSDYPSATTPGYHVLIAIFAKVFTQNVIFLKLISSIITAVFIGLFAGLLYEKAGRLKTIVLLLPMIFSLYIFPDGVWLVPDNLAWLTVGIIFILTATYSLNTEYFVCTGIVLLMAVAVRQPNIWLASVPWAAALSYMLFHNNQKEKKIVYIGMSLLITMPALLLLFYFYHTWGGLVPPSLQVRHERSMSYCVPAFFLSIFLIYSIFYTPTLIHALKKNATHRAYHFIATGSCIGFLIAVIPATDYNYDAGRFSGFWNFVQLAPTIGHTSILLLITSSLGGAVFCSWLLLLKKEFRLTIFLSSLGFVSALIPNALVLERYFSGFVFILIFIMLYHTDDVHWEDLSILTLIGPAMFAIINFAFMFRGIFSGM